MLCTYTSRWEFLDAVLADTISKWGLDLRVLHEAESDTSEAYCFFLLECRHKKMPDLPGIGEVPSADATVAKETDGIKDETKPPAIQDGGVLLLPRHIYPGTLQAISGPVMEVVTRRSQLVTLTPAMLREVSSALPSWGKTLLSLDLSLQPLGASHSCIAEALKSEQLIALTSLILRGTKFGNAGACGLWEALEAVPSLRILNLSDCLIQQVPAAPHEALAHVTELNLSRNAMGDEAAPALAMSLSGAVQMSHLDLGYNQFTGLGLSRLIKKGLPQEIEGFVLTSNPIGCFGASELALALPKLPSLHHLDVRGCQIGDDGVPFLAEAWKETPRLSTVLVSSNNVGDVGCEAIACALDECHVETLVMAMGAITEAGAEILAACLSESHLTSLDLAGHVIGDAGAEAFATSLEDCGKLRTLDLSQNGIGDVGAIILAEYLPLSSRLEALELNKGNVGRDGALALAAALPSCKSLARLGLEENFEFGVEARAVLEQGNVAVVSPLRGAIGVGS